MTRFGEVSYLGFAYENDAGQIVNDPVIYDAKITADLTLTAKLNDKINFTIGSNNLFNTYPTQQIANDNTDSGGYWDSTQMGFGGAYYYARLGFSF